MGNLYAALPDHAADEEIFDALAEGDGVRIERIVSTGQTTPEGQWLEQDRDEWVALLQGDGALQFEGEAEERPMKPGDWVLIRAGTRHRVVRTARNSPTVWLAVHYGRPR